MIFGFKELKMYVMTSKDSNFLCANGRPLPSHTKELSFPSVAFRRAMDYMRAM